MKVSDSEGLLFKRFKPEGFEDVYFKGLLTKGILSDSRYTNLLSFCLKKKSLSQEFMSDNDFPVTNQVKNEVISLPMHTELEEKTQVYIIDKIKEFYGD